MTYRFKTIEEAEDYYTRNIAKDITDEEAMNDWLQMLGVNEIQEVADDFREFSNQNR